MYSAALKRDDNYSVVMSDPKKGRMGMSVGSQATPSDAVIMAQLVGRVAAERDRASYRTLFDHFAPRIRAFLLRRGLSPAQADDLTQDAMLAIWRRAESYDPAKAAVATWVYSIARNLHIDYFRKTARASRVDLKDPSLQPVEEPTADELYDRSQSVDAVVAALSGLPDEQRLVLDLAYMEGCSHSEIAERLDMPLGTVKSRIRLAMDKLRISLGEAI